MFYENYSQVDDKFNYCHWKCKSLNIFKKAISIKVFMTKAIYNENTIEILFN